jgi:hypothetical protein
MSCQLARRYGDLALSPGSGSVMRPMSSTSVRTRQRQPVAIERDQHVRQDRQRLAAFHDTGDQTQGLQQGFAWKW